MHREKYSSLGLNWLTKKLRHLPLPLVFLSDEMQYGGVYLKQSKTETIWEDTVFPPSNGIIVLGNYASQPTDSVIAHEFRHHWQLWNGYKSDNLQWDLETTYETYENNIVAYFKSSKTEMDALKFELKTAPSDLSLEWMNWIQKG